MSIVCFCQNVNIKFLRDGSNAYYQLKLEEKAQEAILTVRGWGGDVN